MQIYKTWNTRITGLLPAFKDQLFIVFIPETEEEKRFLLNFFSFLSLFVEDLDSVVKELESKGVSLSKDEENKNLLILCKHSKFYLHTSLEEYLVPRDSFIELLKFLRKLFEKGIEKTIKKSQKNSFFDEKKEVEASFCIVDGNIKLVNDADDNQELKEIQKHNFEDEMIDFIDQIFLRFDKKPKTQSQANNNQWPGNK